MKCEKAGCRPLQVGLRLYFVGDDLLDVPSLQRDMRCKAVAPRHHPTTIMLFFTGGLCVTKVGRRVAKRREGLNKHHGAVFVPERDRPAGRPSTPTGFHFMV